MGKLLRATGITNIPLHSRCLFTRYTFTPSFLSFYFSSPSTYIYIYIYIYIYKCTHITRTHARTHAHIHTHTHTHTHTYIYIYCVCALYVVFFCLHIFITTTPLITIFYFHNTAETVLPETNSSVNIKHVFLISGFGFYCCRSNGYLTTVFLIMIVLIEIMSSLQEFSCLFTKRTVGCGLLIID